MKEDGTFEIVSFMDRAGKVLNGLGSLLTGCKVRHAASNGFCLQPLERTDDVLVCSHTES